jgi:glycosyltransferase involved in cell wall biosynthesis
MRIGIDARMYPYTGIGRYIQHLLYWLQELDTKNDYVIFLYPEEARRLTFKKNFSVVTVTNRIYSLSEQLHLAKTFQEENLDLLHVPHFNAPLLYRGNLIITIHDITQTLFANTETFLSKIKKLGYIAVMKGVTRKAKKILSVSENTKNDLVEKFKVDPKKIEVVYLGTEEGLGAGKIRESSWESLATKFALTSNYLLYVGVWSVHKNLQKLIEAFVEVKRQSNVPIQLVIAGKEDPRYAPALRDAIKKNSLANDVILTGFVSDEELIGLYKHTSLFVFPSLYEGFGLPPLEAMALGVPVASSSSSSLPEVLGPAAAYFDPLDTANMAQVILSVLQSPEKQSLLIELGKKQVSTYSWKNMVEKTLSSYETI